jgi:hypothetical protein
MLAGVPFVDAVTVTARAAVSASPRAGFAPPPPAAVEEFLEATGGPLVEPAR